MHSRIPIPKIAAEDIEKAPTAAEAIAAAENIKSKASMASKAGGLLTFLVDNVIKAAPRHLPDKAKDFVERHTDPENSMLGAPYRAFEHVMNKTVSPLIDKANLSPDMDLAFSTEKRSKYPARPVNAPTVNTFDYIAHDVGPYDSYVSWKDKIYGGSLVATAIIAKRFGMKPVVSKLHKSTLTPAILKKNLLGFGSEVSPAPKVLKEFGERLQPKIKPTLKSRAKNMSIGASDFLLGWGVPITGTSLAVSNTKYLSDDLDTRRNALYIPDDLKTALKAQGVNIEDAKAINKYLSNIPIDAKTGKPVIETRVKEVGPAKSVTVEETVKNLTAAKEDAKVQTQARKELAEARKNAQADIDSANEESTSALRMRPAVAGVIGAAAGGTLGYMIPRKKRDKIFWSLLGSNVGFVVPYVALALAKSAPAISPMLKTLRGYSDVSSATQKPSKEVENA